MKANKPKALLPLAGQPLFCHALKVFVAHPRVDRILLTVPPGTAKLFMRWVRNFTKCKPIQVIDGGKTRCLSVRNALGCLAPETKIVLIHDAARPFVTKKMVDRLLDGLKNDSAVIVAVPAKSTIKRVDPETGYVAATLDRRVLREVQTPQGFYRHVIVRAHGEGCAADALDDASLVERQGERVRVLPGEDSNIKLTTPEDMKIARAVLSASTRGKGKKR